MAPRTLGIVFVAIILAGMAAWWLFFWYQRRQRRRFFFQKASPRGNFTTIEGIKLHYTVQGRGPDILLVHGLAANIYTWRKLVPLLATRYTVWSVDMKGFGLSDKPEKSDYSVQGQAGLLWSFLKAQKVDRCILIGSSLGGMVAGEMAASRPENTYGLVLIDSAYDPAIFALRAKATKKFLETLLPLTKILSPLVTRESVTPFFKILHGPDYKATSEDIHAYLEPYMKDNQAHEPFVHSLKSIFEYSTQKRLTAAHVPTLLLWGGKDKIVPLRLGQRLHDEIPESELHVKPNAGHHVQEEDPVWTASMIEDFLSRKIKV